MASIGSIAAIIVTTITDTDFIKHVTKKIFVTLDYDDVGNNPNSMVRPKE